MKVTMFKNIIPATCRIILLISFIFNSPCINAQQSKIDSLKNLIANTKKDTAKIDLYENLAQAYRDARKLDSSILTYQQAVELNRKINFSPLRQCYNMSTMDYLYYVTGNYTKSLEYASKVLMLSEKLHDLPQMAHAHQQFGFNYMAFGSYREALNHFFKAKELFERHNHPEIDLESPAFAIVYIGYIYLKLNQPDSALTYVQSGYKLATTMSLRYVIDFALRIFGDIFLVKNNDQLALNYYRQYTNDFYKYNENNRDIGFVFNSMSKIFQKSGQTDSSVYYARKALSNAEKYRDQENIYAAATALYNSYKDKDDHKTVLDIKGNSDNTDKLNRNENISTSGVNRFKIDSVKKEIAFAKTDTAKISLYENLGQAYRDEKKIDSSILSYQRALKINEENNFSLQKQCWDIATIDYLLYITGNYTESLKYATRNVELCNILNDTFQMGFCHATFGHDYKALGEYRLSLNHYFKARQIFKLYLQVRNVAENDPYIIQCIGDVYLKMNQLDSALIYTQQSLVQKGLDPGNELYSIRILGDIYRAKGDDQRALNYYREYIPGFIKYNTPDFIEYKQNSRDLGFVFNSIAKIFQKNRQPDSAMFYAEKALENAKEYHDEQNIYGASNTLYQLNDSLKNEVEAFKYFKMATVAKDSMASIEKIRQIQNLTYNEQVREKETQAADAKEAARNRLIIIIAAVLVSIISFLIWNRLRQLKLKHKMILEQKEAEKLRAIDKMKEKFFSNITHELRTPLSLIMSPAGFYLEHPEELNDTGKFLKSIYKNSGYLLNLINQLLDISKLDAGKMNIALSKGNFGNYIDDLVKTFKDEAIKKQLALHFDNDLTGAYLFDEEHWKKIINNLLGNALKFTPPNGDIFVSVTKISGATESASIQVIVKDTGIGIDEDQVPFITDRFYQADNKLSRKYEGAGIGLSLVNELVKLMDGKLQIKSEKGKGSVFTITATLLSARGKEGYPEIIPVVKTSQLSDINTNLIDIPVDGGKNVPLILVAEDNKELRDFLKDSIEPLYKVITASDGGEGFEMALTQIPDIIISDVMMPVMDGFEFCDKIKSSHATSHIPFIILSAKTNYESRIEGLQKGADDYLTKPFSVDELRTKIKNILQRQKKLQEYNLQQLLSENPLPAFTEVQNEFLQGIYKNIEDNLDDAQLTVEFLATKMALSEGTLNRKLIANIGVSANELIKQYHLKRAEMQKQMLELEAKALRAQMNPHFIFNCLNSIKSLIQQNENKKSVTYLTIFSKLIRTLFNNADKKAISLYDEIETCKLYLQLEKMRFDEKFSYAVNVEDNIDLKSIQVPALIIQPFIENAIWHGIVPRNTGGYISLNVLQKNDVIEVAVEDDGIGRESSQQNKSTSGLAHQSKGVNLTQSRMELNNLLQQRQAKLEIIDKKDENGTATGTTVIIKIKEEQL